MIVATIISNTENGLPQYQKSNKEGELENLVISLKGHWEPLLAAWEIQNIHYS